MIYRPYNRESDEKAAIRIWRECGWPDMKKNRKVRDAFRLLLAEGTADVVEHAGAAECLVTTSRGTIRMLETELPFRAVTCVTAGRPLRRMGGAGELTARAVMNAAEAGDAVAGLGIFDQGFYNKLGFGNFPYSRTVTFDPLTLDVPSLTRPPIRLGPKDLSRIVSSTLERKPNHGLVKIPSEAFTGMMMAESENGFCLGFEDENGRLTHHLFAKPEGENGPYEVWWLVYQDHAGLMELLSVIKSLGDQVNSFEICEPWGIQFQDLLKRPFRNREITRGNKFTNEMQASSYKQARILDMEQVLAAVNLPTGNVRFNLKLSDPINRYLPDDAEWKGLDGVWTVELDEGGSAAVLGEDDTLPMMSASVGAFTRLLFGVATATGLAVTDDLSAPEALLADLDRRLRFPMPDMVQEF